MLLRGLTYVVLGWLLLAAVPGLAHVFDLSVALPSTTAVVLLHVAFRGHRDDEPLAAGLAVAVVLGYLEDLHQGAPTGTLTLVHALTYLLLYQAAQRISLPGIVAKGLAAAATLLVIDMLTWGVLMLLADPLGMQRDALTQSLSVIGWRALETFLLAYPVWFLLDWIFPALRLAEPVEEETQVPSPPPRNPRA